MFLSHQTRKSTLLPCKLMRKSILHHGKRYSDHCVIKFCMNMKAFEQKQPSEKIKVWNFNDPERWEKFSKRTEPTTILSDMWQVGHHTEISCQEWQNNLSTILHFNTKLFSISFPQLRGLQKVALESTNFDYSSAEYRVTAIVLDIANYRLFRPVRSDVPAKKPKHFMKIKFLNKAVDAINLPALLRSTSVQNSSLL